MHQIAALFTAAAVVVMALKTTPAQAHNGWGDYPWGNQEWREQVRHDHEWRQRAWHWHEWGGWHPSYYNYGSYEQPDYHR